MSAHNASALLSAMVVSSEHRYNLETETVARLNHISVNTGRYSQFQLGPRAQAHATAMGLAYDPQAPGNHGHPLSKLYEDYILRVALPPLLRGSAFTVLFMKDAKFARLMQDVDPARGEDAYLANYLVTAADVNRYTTPMALPLRPVETPACFVHDAIHHFLPGDLYALFDSSPELSRLYATAIIPPGLALGVRKGSTALYAYKVEGGELVYAPDGNYQDSYRQPVSCLWLLEVGRLVTPGFVLTIHVVQTYDSVHLLQVTRGEFHAPVYQNVRVPGLSWLPREVVPFFDQGLRLVPTEAAQLTRDYSLQIASPNIRNLRGRLRLWRGDHKAVAVTHGQAECLISYCLALHRSQPDFADTYLPVTSWHHWVTRCGPVRWLRLLALFPVRAAFERGIEDGELTEALYKCHERTIKVGLHTPHGLLTDGRFPQPTGEQLRAALLRLSCGAPGRYDDVPVEATAPSLLERVVRIVELVALGSYAPKLAATLSLFAARFGVRVASGMVRRPAVTAGAVFGLGCLGVCAAPALAGLAYRAEAAAVAALSNRIRRMLYAVGYHVPALHALDLSLHCFFLNLDPQCYDDPRIVTEAVLHPAAAPARAEGEPSPGLPTSLAEPAAEPACEFDDDLCGVDWDKLSVVSSVPSGASSRSLDSSARCRPSPPPKSVRMTAPVHAVDVTVHAPLLDTESWDSVVNARELTVRVGPHTAFDYLVALVVTRGPRGLFLNSVDCAMRGVDYEVLLREAQHAPQVAVSLSPGRPPLLCVAANCELPAAGTALDRVQCHPERLIGPCATAAELGELPHAYRPDGSLMTWAPHGDYWEGICTPPYPARDDCLLVALGLALAVPAEEVWRTLARLRPHRAALMWAAPFHLDSTDASMVAGEYDMGLTVRVAGGPVSYSSLPHGRCVTLDHVPGHWSFTSNSDDAAPVKLSGGRVPAPISLRPQVPSVMTRRVPRVPPVVAPAARANLWAEILPLCRMFSRSVRASQPRAKAFHRELEEGRAGVLLRRMPNVLKNWHSTVNQPSYQPRVTAAGWMGRPGSGKSHPISLAVQAWGRAHGFHGLTVVVPTDKLRRDWKAQLQLPAGAEGTVKTWELALVQPCAELVILDEAGLLPGMLDLFLFVQPKVRHIVFTADLAQKVSAPAPGCPTPGLIRSPAALLSHAACGYNRAQHRLARGVAAAFGHATSNTDEGGIRFSSLDFGPLVVSTTGAVASHTAMGREVYTAAEVQGSTFRTPYEVIVDKYMERADNRTWYTILTRGTRSVHITCASSSFRRIKRGGCTIMRGLLHLANTGDASRFTAAVRDHEVRWTPAHLADPTNQPGQAIVLKGGALEATTVLATLRAQASTATDTLNAAPENWYVGRSRYADARVDEANSRTDNLELHYQPLGDLEEVPGFHREDAAPAPAPSSELLQFTQNEDLMLYPAHMLIDQPERCADVIEGILTPKIFDREHCERGAYTQQVDGTDAATGLFLKHKRDDRATEAWTYRERYVAPRQPSVHYLGAGRALFDAFKYTYCPVFPGYNPAFMELCMREDYSAFLDKGDSTLRNIAYRNDPFLDPKAAEVFLKVQHITKLGTEYREAKKGQMITGFGAVANERFGALARYVYNAMRTALPESILLLNGVTPQDQEDWFAKHWNFAGPSYEDDYTGFDGTQNEDFLSFQMFILRALHLPESLIEDYLEWVTDLRGMGKPFGIFIASGFKPTWLFNTLDSMAYQALKHKLQRHLPGTAHVARAFSGDDTLHNEQVFVRPEFDKLPHTFRLISTGGHTTVPHFCGTVNLPCGSFADPTLLCLRVLFKLRIGRLGECAESYAEHCSRLFRNREAATAYLSAKELACHDLTLRLLRHQLRRDGKAQFGEFSVKALRHSFDLRPIAVDEGHSD